MTCITCTTICELWLFTEKSHRFWRKITKDARKKKKKCVEMLTLLFCVRVSRILSPMNDILRDIDGSSLINTGIFSFVFSFILILRLFCICKMYVSKLLLSVSEFQFQMFSNEFVLCSLAHCLNENDFDSAWIVLASVDGANGIVWADRAVKLIALVLALNQSWLNTKWFTNHDEERSANCSEYSNTLKLVSLVFFALNEFGVRSYFQPIASLHNRAWTRRSNDARLFFFGYIASHFIPFERLNCMLIRLMLDGKEKKKSQLDYMLHKQIHQQYTKR